MINKLIIDSLNGVGVPVCFHTYEGNLPTYVTFFEYLQQGESFSENEEEITGHYVQVDIFSDRDYSILVKNIKERLGLIGFKRTNEIDLYESDLKIYHKCLRFFCAENI